MKNTRILSPPPALILRHTVPYPMRFAHMFHLYPTTYSWNKSSQADSVLFPSPHSFFCGVGSDVDHPSIIHARIQDRSGLRKFLVMDLNFFGLLGDVSFGFRFPKIYTPS